MESLINDDDIQSISKQIEISIDKNLFQKTYSRIVNVIRQNYLKEFHQNEIFRLN
jgi:hypothetical protein